MEALSHNGINSPAITYSVKSGARKPRINREITQEEQSKSNAIDSLVIPSKKSNSSNLNPRYTFENFIVGSSNDLAYAACQAVTSHQIGRAHV